MKLTERFDFGKYRGLILQQVINEKVCYVTWLLENVPLFYLDEEAKQSYDQSLNKPIKVFKKNKFSKNKKFNKFKKKVNY